MVRGRTSLPGGHMVLGHEITGEVIEVGQGVEFIKKGDVCSVRLTSHAEDAITADEATPGFV